MIIGFLGKGGSGKSTLSTLACNYFSLSNLVLAIDADHNLDLTFNLNSDPKTFINSSAFDFKNFVGIHEKEKFATTMDKKPIFILNPPDAFTKKYTQKIKENLHIMTVGEHTDVVKYGQSCSHSLATPLVYYLPFLKLRPNQIVIVDEKAGTDSVGTGITTGFDMAVVCTEPTTHSAKVANQIAELLTFYNTPYIFAANKINNPQDKEFLDKNLLKKPDLYFNFNQELVPQSNQLDKLLVLTKQAIASTPSRIIRTKARLEKNQEFSKQEESKKASNCS